MTRKTAHGGNRREIMAQYGLSKLVDFSANLSPLGPPAQVKEIINDSLDLIQEYPPEYPVQLEKTLAKQHNIPPQNIIAGNGSTEIIYLLPYAQKGRAVIIAPSFSEYEQACVAAKQEVLFWPSNADDDFACDWDDFLKRYGQQMSLLFLASPNNPTGKLLPKTKLLSLLQKAQEHDFLLVLDEAFLEFVPDCEQHSLLKESISSQHLLILRSLTKFYAIPGLRLGYAVGNSDIIAKLRAIQAPWSLNCLAQAVGEKLLDLRDYQEQTRKLVSTEREILYKALREQPVFEPYPGAANYLLVKITKPGLTAANLQDKLIQQGFLIRDCANFRGLDESYFRIAVRTPEENQDLLTALKELQSALS